MKFRVAFATVHFRIVLGIFGKVKMCFAETKAICSHPHLGQFWIYTRPGGGEGAGILVDFFLKI